MNTQDDLSLRVQSLENRVKILEQAVQSSQGAPSTQSLEPAKPEVPQEPPKPTWFTDFINWLKEDWLMKLGAALLIIGLVWFVTYAFANNWIGPAGRITLGIMVGILILGAGHLFIDKKRIPAEVLIVTGMTMIILTIFAGKFFYDFFSYPLALGMMMLIMALTATISIVKKAKPIAVSTVIASGIIPLLLGGFDREHTLLLLGYLLVVDLGVLAIVGFRSWRSLIILSLIITGVYATGAFDNLESMADNMFGTWIFMAIFYFLFLLSNFAAIWKDKKAKISDLIAAGLNSLIILGWIFLFVPEHWQSIVLSALAVVSIGLIAVMLKSLENLKISIYIYGGAALGFIIAATAFELKEYEAALIIAFAIEVFLATYFTDKFIKSPKAASSVSTLQAIPLILIITNGSFEYYSWNNISIFNEHTISLFVQLLILYCTAYLLAKTQKIYSIIHASLASVLGIILIWFSAYNLIPNFDLARGVSLVIFTIVGVILLFTSYKDDKKALRIGSSILLGGVVLRLFFVEFWEMPIAGKVITSFLVGTLLIITAFFNKKLIAKK